MPFARLAGLAILMLTLWLAAPLTAQAGVCADIKPYQTRINIDVIFPDPHYDFSKSRKYLTKNSRKVTEKWLEKNKMNVMWQADDLKTAGLASGARSSSYSARMYSKNVDRYYAAFCTFFEEINLTVFYRTLIFIPSDYPQGSCAFDEVHTHELRHHAANKAAIEKYIAKLRADIHELVAMMESGYVGRNEIQGRFEEMKIGMRDAVEVYIGQYIAAETERLNAQVDTVEEYKRASVVLRACKQKDGF